MALAASGYAACSSTDGTGGSGLAQGCTLNSDCDAPLVCTFGMCHTACRTTEDCPTGSRCVQGDGASVCQEQKGCTYTSDCDTPPVFAIDRTGRASVTILDSVHVEAYGAKVPLNQVAGLSVPEPTLIVAQPFDPSLLGTIEKAIRASDLGLNPANDGKVVRIPLPAPT